MPTELDALSTLLRLTATVDTAYTRVCQRLGLTEQQGHLLCLVARPLSTGAAAEALGCDRSNVTRLGDRAEARGWIVRRDGETDGRNRVLALTESGRAVVDALVAGLQDVFGPVLATLSPAQVAALGEVESRLATHLAAGAAYRRASGS